MKFTHLLRPLDINHLQTEQLELIRITGATTDICINCKGKFIEGMYPCPFCGSKVLYSTCIKKTQPESVN